MSCPFYGRSLIGLHAGMHPQLVGFGDSNRCALITDAHAPCAMEIARLAPNWGECDRNPAANGSYIAPSTPPLRRLWSLPAPPDPDEADAVQSVKDDA